MKHVDLPQPRARPHTTRQTSAIIALAVCSLLLLNACVKTETRDASSANGDGNVIHIDGSNGVMPLMRALADAYRADNPDAEITFGGGLGSRARLDSLRAGRMDIAIASHGLDTAALRTEGLVVHRIAVTPVVIGVHAASVSLSGLAFAQLCDVLAGRVSSWRPLGDGRDLPIAVVVRPEDEVDMEVLRERVPCATSLVISPAARVVAETADMARALTETEGGLGITTSTVVSQSNGAIRALTLDQVTPSAATARDGRYSLVRSSYVVTRGQPRAAVARFLDFIRSKSGDEVLENNGSARPRP